MIKRNRIPSIVKYIDETVTEALDGSALSIKEEAQARVPVDSGDLRDAIKVVKVPSGGTYSIRAVVAGDKKVFYGHMVEHGTTKNAPHPFLVPAFEANRAKTESRIKDAVANLTKKGRR